MHEKSDKKIISKNKVLQAISDCNDTTAIKRRNKLIYVVSLNFVGQLKYSQTLHRLSPPSVHHFIIKLTVENAIKLKLCGLHSAIESLCFIKFTNILLIKKEINLRAQKISLWNIWCRWSWGAYCGIEQYTLGLRTCLFWKTIISTLWGLDVNSVFT